MRAGGAEKHRETYRAGDFALAVSDGRCDMLIRGDAGVVAALRKRGLSNGGM